MSLKAHSRPSEPPKGLVLPVFMLALGIVFILTSSLIWLIGPGPKSANGEVRQVVLGHGMGVNAMADMLKSQHIIRSKLAFKLMIKLSGRENDLRAGSYLFPSQISLLRVVSYIRLGKVVQNFITIAEGKTSAQVVKIIEQTNGLVGDINVPPEGSVLPETYQYEIGETRQTVLDRMLEAARNEMDREWSKRQTNLPFDTKEDALILASVVEKETGIKSERAKVAAVFVNRLRLGMPLQSDPTVVYGVSKGEPLGRGLTRAELDKDTPWNTYTINRLPITPIANPGKAAIEAVLNPAQTHDLYFVADGTGGHAFASTYEEHLENVARWRKIEAANK